jgi:hypothetical protein
MNLSPLRDGTSLLVGIEVLRLLAPLVAQDDKMGAKSELGVRQGNVLA